MKYKEVAISLIKEVNNSIYKKARILSFFGIIVLGCSVGFFEVGTIRSIGLILALVLIILPFALSFFLDTHANIGVIRITDKEVIIKLNQENSVILEINKLDKFEYHIKDFEGETKGQDLLRASSRMNVRTGTDNQIMLKHNDIEYQFLFKLKSELQKRQAIYFFKHIENQMIKEHTT